MSLGEKGKICLIVRLFVLFLVKISIFNTVFIIFYGFGLLSRFPIIRDGRLDTRVEDTKTSEN